MSSATPPQSVNEERFESLEDGPQLPVLLTEGFIQQLEKGVTQYKKYLSIICRLTEPQHWCNHGTEANPTISLQAPGAEALMNPLGISFDKPDYRKEFREDKEGNRFYVIFCEGYMESKTLRRRGYYIGYCDSRDQFFNARPGWSADTGEGDVMKAAFSNWEVNGVSRIAGIRAPSVDMLKGAGIDLTKITKIQYGGDKGNKTIKANQVGVIWGKAREFKVSKDTVVNAIKSMGYDPEALADVMVRGEFDALLKWIEGNGKGAVPKGTGSVDYKKASEGQTDGAAGAATPASGSAATATEDPEGKVDENGWTAIWSSAGKQSMKKEDVMAYIQKTLGYKFTNELKNKDVPKVTAFIAAGGDLPK